MKIAEVFGPTVQGEGPHAGQPSMFVRLGRCNLDCAWCDTPYTWDWRGVNGTVFDPAVELTDADPVVLARSVDAQVPPHGRVVLTGGEPMLQQRDVAEFIGVLFAELTPVDIETNATRPLIGALADANEYGATFVCSPKLHSSGVDRDRAWVPEAIATYKAAFASWKFVVADGYDLGDVDEFVDRFDIDPAKVWLMPEGRTADDIVRRSAWVHERAIERSMNVSTRLHVLAYDDRRGV